MSVVSLSTADSRRISLSAVVLGVLGLLVTAPFLWPVHRPPQTIFDSEWLSAVTFCLLLAAIAAMRPATLRVGWLLPGWFAVLLGLTFLQLKLGRLSHHDQFYFAFLYAAAAVAAYLAGRALVAHGLVEAACRAMGLALIIGGLLSVCVQVMQLLNVSGLPWWLYFEITDPWIRSRPNGNVGQANILATYLCWGMLSALLVLRDRKLLVPALIVLAVLALGVGLTRSRMALLFLLAVFALLWLPTALRPATPRRRIAFSMALVVGYGVSMVAIDALVRFEGAELPSALGRLTEGTLALRTVMWSDALKVAATAPWLGVGFSDYGATHYWVAQFHPALQPTAYVHNLVLQVAAEMGWPMALALVAIVSWWLLRRLKQRLDDPSQAFVWVLVSLVGLHSLLEWPLHMMLFLIPGCLLFALGEPQSSTRALPLNSRLLVVGALFGLVLAVPTFMEYDDLSTSMRDVQARLSSNKEIDDAALGTLLGLASTSRVRPFADRVLLFLMPPHRIEPTAEEIDRLERAHWQQADPRIITRLIVVNARAGRYEESVRHVDRLLVFFPEEFELRRTYMLSALKPLGPDADVLRRALENAVIPKVERPNGMPARPEATTD